VHRFRILLLCIALIAIAGCYSGHTHNARSYIPTTEEEQGIEEVGSLVNDIVPQPWGVPAGLLAMILSDWGIRFYRTRKNPKKGTEV